MSVYKSRRKDAAAQFVVQLRTLRELTLQNVKRMPKSYRYVITNNMLKLAAEAYTSCIRANDIYLYKDIDPNDYALRHRYLVMAKGAVDALTSEITFLYAILSQGDNCYKNDKARDKAFYTWIGAAYKSNEYIKAIINSDKQRWHSYKKAAVAKQVQQ